jgi:hypothetical protein
MFGWQIPASRKIMTAEFLSGDFEAARRAPPIADEA